MTDPVIIGDATLYLGDCLEILPEIGKVEMIFTDPPYGHNNNNNGDLISRWEIALGRGRGGDPRPIVNDGIEADSIFRASLSEFVRLLPAGGCCCCCCCCGGGGPDPQFAKWSLWIDEYLRFKQMVIWDKGPMGMGWHYRRSYETILVAEKPGAATKWYDETNRIENVIRPGMYGISKIIPNHQQHPTEKPIGIAGLFINLHSRLDDIVLDPFMGSGTTGVAALKLGRKFIGIEIDPKWFDVACKRIDEVARQGTFDLGDRSTAPTPRSQGLFE